VLHTEDLRFITSERVMASLEPPIPANAAYVFETPSTHVDSTQEQGFLGWKGKAGQWAKWRRLVGILLLFLTVFLWTVSNFLASVRRICMAFARSIGTDDD
jgi:hypothetical protein